MRIGGRRWSAMRDGGMESVSLAEEFNQGYQGVPTEGVI